MIVVKGDAGAGVGTAGIRAMPQERHICSAVSLLRLAVAKCFVLDGSALRYLPL